LKNKLTEKEKLLREAKVDIYSNEKTMKDDQDLLEKKTEEIEKLKKMLTKT
jgi:hypothetical protein